VVVEKPFTPTSKEADGLIALAKEKGKLITVYQSMILSLDSIAYGNASTDWL
jgi:predicted dehydrogenase